jgi:hypothetical protein
MADQKLSPSLFSAKARITQPEGSTPYLHFIAAVRQHRNQFVFVCESTPLLSFGSYGGVPLRCPACGALLPSDSSGGSN